MQSAAAPGDRRPSGSSTSNFQLVSTNNGAERSGQLRMTLKRKSPVRETPRDDADACDDGCTCKATRKQNSNSNSHNNSVAIATNSHSHAAGKVTSGTLTEPQYFGPCEPGTQVNLGAEVWLDADDGLLSLNVTWRGRSYTGVLLDTTRLGWAPPQLAAPLSDEPGRPPRGRKRRAAQSPFCASLAARRSSGARPPARRPVRNAEPCLDDSNSQQSSASSAPEPSPPPRTNPEEDDNLFCCTQSGCLKRYRNAAALRHHQAHAHTNANQQNEDKPQKPPKRRRRASAESPDTIPAPEPVSDGNVHSPAYSDISDTPTTHGEPEQPTPSTNGLFGVPPTVPPPPVVAPPGISVIIAPPPGPPVPSPAAAAAAAFLVGPPQASPPLFAAQPRAQPRAAASPLMLAAAPFACVKQPKAAAIVTPIFKPNEPTSFGGRRSVSPNEPAPPRKSDAPSQPRRADEPTLLKPSVRDENAARPPEREQPPTFGVAPQPKPFLHGMLPIPMGFGTPNTPDASLAALMQLAAPIDKNVLAYVSANLAGPPGPGSQPPGTLPPGAMQLRDLQAVFGAHMPGFALPK